MPKTQLNARQLHTEGEHDIATDDEVRDTVHAAIQEHEAADDPHHQYLPRSEYHEGTDTDLTQVIQQLTHINTEIVTIIANDTALAARVTALEDHEAHEDDSHNDDSHNHPCCCRCTSNRAENHCHETGSGSGGQGSVNGSSRSTCCRRSNCNYDNCGHSAYPQECCTCEESQTETHGHCRNERVKLQYQEFLDRFTIVERAAIKVWIDRYAARRTCTMSPEELKIGAFCVVADEYIARRKKVNLRDYNVITLVNQYEQYGILENGRARQILSV